MPQCTFTVSGDIKDFTRADNLYVSLKREMQKLLTNWTITADIKYSEQEGQGTQT